MDTSTFFLLLLISILVLAGGVVLAVRLSNPSGTRRNTPVTGPRIEISLGSERTRTIPLPSRGAVTIGRDPSCTLQIDHHLVSRRHARIVAEAGRWLIEDTDSSNGTFLNGRSVVRARLNLDDLIEIGPARIVMTGIASAPPPPKRESIVVQSTPTPTTPGTTRHTNRRIFADHIILGTLGEGGFGKILLAQEQRGQRLVALKLLNTTDDYLQTKFRQEGALKLDHQHIAKIYSTGEGEGWLYIAMEYVDGINLRKLLDTKPMALDAALAIVGQMLSALEHAHNRGVIHRDIKPENVMLTAQHGVKIIDFGIAKVLSTVTRTRDGLVVGTPQYMSYEQAMGQPVTPSSDLYSTAIVLYELITAHVPFTAENAIEIVRLHQNSRPLPPRQLNPAIPVMIEAAILRAMEKDAGARFGSAREFAQALGCPLGQGLPPELTTRISQLSRSGGAGGDEGNRRSKVTAGGIRSQPQLRVETGSRRGQVIALTPAQEMGRMEIDPADNMISRSHFRLEQQQGMYTIRDKSSYGTFVNGMRLQRDTPYPLVPGARIQVGQTTLIYEEAGRSA